MEGKGPVPPNPEISLVLEQTIAERVNRALTEIVLPRLNAIAERLQAALPNEEIIVQRVLAHQAAASPVHANGNVAPPPPEPIPVTETPPIHWLDKVIGAIDYAFGKWMEFKALEFAQKDVFALAAQLRETRPLHASVLGQLLAPDPMAPHVPGIMAHQAITTWDAARSATIKSLTEAGWIPPQPGQALPNGGALLPVNPLGPASAGSLPAGSAINPPTLNPSSNLSPKEVSLFRQWASK